MVMKVSYIMIQGDPENVDAQYRTEFSVKALTDAGVEVEELLKQRGDWDQAKAQQDRTGCFKPVRRQDRSYLLQQRCNGTGRFTGNRTRWT